MKTSTEHDPVEAAPKPNTAAAAADNQASFAETALKLGGKSEDEARRTGAIDKADDQVEALFAAQYQTVNSPVHRAVWDRTLPIDLFASRPPLTPPDVNKVMEDSLSVMRRHRASATVFDENGKIGNQVMEDLSQAGYWGLLVDKQYGGSGAPFASFAPFLTRMALIDPTVAGLASVHGCIGRSTRCARSAMRSKKPASCRDWPTADPCQASHSPSPAPDLT